ncbi:hypothetical protein QBC36DRAFT_127478 [Triangularia setosa]|uniref:Uncharacterized protein n=1 Tax=Triangularia setosa TaxID=2587417 RepID=A0AAN6WCL6_9PEZI|nr:hypothetical protein QBC36DRAFT_127478 [Podospora setosa]
MVFNPRLFTPLILRASLRQGLLITSLLGLLRVAVAKIANSRSQNNGKDEKLAKDGPPVAAALDRGGRINVVGDLCRVIIQVCKNAMEQNSINQHCVSSISFFSCIS